MIKRGTTFTGKDKARFRDEDVEAVFFGFPRCLLTGKSGAEKNHTMGRGTARDDEDRYLHSSIYNCSPLIDEIHDGGRVNDPDFRRCLLKWTEEKVHDAIRDGRYILREIDNEFQNKYQEF